jgi:hypothetical protein
MQNITAYTEADLPREGLVEFVSINAHAAGVGVCVRNRAGDMIEVVVPAAEWSRMARAIFAHAAIAEARATVAPELPLSATSLASYQPPEA